MALIIVHYRNGKEYTMGHNDWVRVPNKLDIISLEIITPFNIHHLLEAPKDKKVVFFAQRVGYTMQVGGKVFNMPYAGDQVGMFIDSKGTCKLLEVDRNGERRCQTDLKGLGFNELSLKMLGINLKVLEDKE